LSTKNTSAVIITTALVLYLKRSTTSSMLKASIFTFILFFVFVAASSQEICNNGIDDDGDGFTDLQDNKCTPAVYPLLKNPSFEKISQCPDFYSQLNYAFNWFQPGPGITGSTDLYHTCGGCSYKFGGISVLLPKPAPDGVGFAGFIDSKEWMNSGIWKEYISACPDAPLQKDSAYVLDFFLGFMAPLISNNGQNFNSFSPAPLSIFGHLSCGGIPYATSGNNSFRACPVTANNGWVELAKFTVSGNAGQWVQARAEFISPANIGAIAIGPSCEASPYGANNNAGYYGIDQVLLYKKDIYDLPRISRSGDICSDTLKLTASTNLPVAAGAWQWYRDDKVLAGETSAVLALTRTKYGTGTYKVRMTANNKTFHSPETDVAIDETEFSMADSLDFCAGKTVGFGPQVEQEEAACNITYLWSDGLATSNRTFSTGGLYWFETNKNGCRNRDSIRVIEHPAPLVSLGADTTLCNNASFVLSAGNAGASYQWQNNSTAQQLTVTRSGNYHVQVTAFGCTTADTIVVKYETAPELRFAADTLLCNNEQKRLAPHVYGNSFLWNTGSTSPEIIVTQPGVYELEVQNFCGVTSDSISIKRINCEFWVPTAFTPNNDNRNERFGLAITGFVKKYNCRIYNRWGQLVFSSTDAKHQWDGAIKGKPATAGVYAWVIEYTDWSNNSDLRKGTVLLIR
jgi:gliding motility-associated-like protein